MEDQIQPNIPPVQPIPQAPVSPTTNWKKIILFILLGLIVIAVSVLIGIQIGKNQVTSQQPTISPTQTVVNPTPTLAIIQTKSLPDSTIIKEWKHYSNERFSVELPDGWNIFDLSNQKTYYEDIPSINLILTDNATDPRYDPTTLNGSSNTVGVSLGTMYSDKKWNDLTSTNTFFDLQSKLWTDTMRQSGGGALLQTTIRLDQLASKKAVKRINTWTQAMEGVDSVDTDYFLPDSKSTDRLLVWDINYRLPLKGNDLTERKKTVDQILSTFKFTN